MHTDLHYPRVVLRSKFMRCLDLMLDVSVPKPSILSVTTRVDFPRSLRGIFSDRRLRLTCQRTNIPITPKTARPCREALSCQHLEELLLS